MTFMIGRLRPAFLIDKRTVDQSDRNGYGQCADDDAWHPCPRANQPVDQPTCGGDPDNEPRGDSTGARRIGLAKSGRGRGRATSARHITASCWRGPANRVLGDRPVASCSRLGRQRSPASQTHPIRTDFERGHGAMCQNAFGSPMFQSTRIVTLATTASFVKAASELKSTDASFLIANCT